MEEEKNAFALEFVQDFIATAVEKLNLASDIHPGLTKLENHDGDLPASSTKDLTNKKAPRTVSFDEQNITASLRANNPDPEIVLSPINNQPKEVDLRLNLGKLSSNSNEVPQRVGSNSGKMSKVNTRSFSDLTLEEQEKYFIRNEALGSKEILDSHPTKITEETSTTQSDLDNLSQTTEPPDPAVLTLGKEVEANYGNRGQYFSGRIAAINEDDNTYDIEYDYGEYEERVKLNQIRLAPPMIAAVFEPALAITPEKSRVEVKVFRIGDRVEANYREKGKYYPGTIRKIRDDDLYDIGYDDGEMEVRVKATNIKEIPVAREALKVGTKVEANYRGRGKYYPGKVSKDRGDGTFDIDYDDGEKEARVREDLIRVVAGEDKSLSTPVLTSAVRHEAITGATASSPTGNVTSTAVIGEGNKLRVGAKVEANYRGRGKYYPGKVSKDRGDGTFDIDYDDGEKEARVREELIRIAGAVASGLVNAGSSAAATTCFKEGEKVEANYRKKGRFYPGRIAAINEDDNTYDIEYDYGEYEERVKLNQIRLAPPMIAAVFEPALAITPEKSRVEVKVFRIGDRVEANYREKGKYYPGTIGKIRDDDLYDIGYDDGEIVVRVKATNINEIPMVREALKVGTKVEANYRGRGKYYPGKVSKDRGDGTFDIDYDDGEKEARVREELIRVVAGEDKSLSTPVLTSAVRHEAITGATASSPTGNVTSTAVIGEGNKLRVGTKVEANYRGRGKYYPGKVSKDRGDGTFDIDYDDGEKEARVREELIRVVGGTVAASGGFKEGDKVETNYRGKGRYYLGRIRRDRGDGSYDIDYDDGEKEARVRAELIRIIGGSVVTGSVAAAGGVAAAASGGFKEGDKVEANYRDKGRYYPGKVRRVNADGTYDIDYDDGESERRVKKELIRALGGVAVTASSTGSVVGEGNKLQVGTKVEANYRGRGKYYTGKVSKDRGDGTFDIDYDDGEKEARVREELIRIIGGSVVTGSVAAAGGVVTGSSSFKEGDKVEANFRGAGRYYPGKIRRVNVDGTCDIDYDDGESERRVKEDWIKVPDLGGSRGRLSRSRSPARMPKLEEGMKVEANFRGAGRYYPGKIRRVNVDGTCDIDYDDGESERRVKEDWIKVPDLGGSRGRLSRSRSPARKPKLEEGMKVEANYRGRGKYYPGKLSRDRGDGTFDIDYDDGEKEARVREKLIRVVGGTVAASGGFKEGDKVEANYRGKGRYYLGRIRRDRGDGSYDIDYDDGESETRVRAELIRSVAPAAVAAAEPTPGIKLQVGSKVEANYRGRGKYYPGKVSKDRGDGTFDIDYDDGEKEARVREELIRIIGGSVVTGSIAAAGGVVAGSSSFKEGDKVEANYRDKGRYYPGKVRRVNADGTYDIDYDDGESERRVKEELIRALGGVAVTASSTGSVVGEGNKLQVGTKVEANYRGRGKYYPGKVSKDRGDGTFDIDYDDGEKEARVRDDLIRIAGAAAPGPEGTRSKAAVTTNFKEGGKVEANYRNKGRWYVGRIRRDRGDGTYDIDYDEDVQETRVPASLIRPLTTTAVTPSSSSTKAVFQVGDKVEANYRGRGRYFPATVRFVHESDRTYDILYDDGDSESKVPGSQLRVFVARTAEVLYDLPLKVGDKVMVNYRQKGKFYPGQIQAVRSDGLYDVNYDDGEQEVRVGRNCIRLLTHAQSMVNVQQLAENNTNNNNNTTDNSSTSYNNNPATTAIPASVISSSASFLVVPSTNGAAAKALTFEVGMRVEVNYQSLGKFYPATITARNEASRSYDVKYDHLEAPENLETGVSEERLIFLDEPVPTVTATATANTPSVTAVEEPQPEPQPKQQSKPKRISEPDFSSAFLTGIASSEDEVSGKISGANTRPISAVSGESVKLQIPSISTTNSSPAKAEEVISGEATSNKKTPTSGKITTPTPTSRASLLLPTSPLFEKKDYKQSVKYQQVQQEIKVEQQKLVESLQQSQQQIQQTLVQTQALKAAIQQDQKQFTEMADICTSFLKELQQLRIVRR